MAGLVQVLGLASEWVQGLELDLELGLVQVLGLGSAPVLDWVLELEAEVAEASLKNHHLSKELIAGSPVRLRKS